MRDESRTVDATLEIIAGMLKMKYSVPLIRDGEKLARVEGISMEKTESGCKT